VHPDARDLDGRRAVGRDELVEAAALGVEVLDARAVGSIAGRLVGRDRRERGRREQLAAGQDRAGRPDL